MLALLWKYESSKTLQSFAKSLWKYWDAGYTDVVEAVDGKDALSKASDVDIVFTDWNMPVMDGLTLVKELMKSSTVPVIMVTTEGGQAQRLEAMRAGVNDYIVKPYEKSTLLGKLESIGEQ